MSGFDHDRRARATGRGKAGITAALGNRTPCSRGGSDTDNGEALSPRPENNTSGDNSAAPESEGRCGEDDSAEESSLDIDESESGRETASKVGQMGRTESVVPGGSVKSTPAQLDCLRGR